MTVPHTSPRLVVVRAVSMRSNQPSEPRDRGIADGESEAGSEASDALTDEAFMGSEGVSAIANSEGAVPASRGAADAASADQQLHQRKRLPGTPGRGHGLA